jgi:glutamate-1-semialdehyde 2,1-aminomutase
MFLKKAGSGVATLGIKQEGGIPAAVTDDTLVIEFNDFEALEQTVKAHAHEMAAIIVEPVAGNMGCVLPEKGFLQLLRDLCTKHDIILIFDEVMTGFRLAKGGAQQHFDVWADLVTYGKVIGGGLPVGAFGGRKDIMSCIAPLGNVYQAGTLSGNPIAMCAGYTTLQHLNNNAAIYPQLEHKCQWLAENISRVMAEKKIPVIINHIGSMISVHFCPNPVTDFKSASAGNNGQFKKFFHHALDNGIYLPPSPFESWFLSAALTDGDLQATVDACDSFEI